MKLYIEIEQRNYQATSNYSKKMYVTVDNIFDLESAIISQFIKNTTWATLLSYKVIARLDGACNTVAKEYYQTHYVNVEAAKEYYADTKEGMKLINRVDAVINNNLAA